MHELQLYYFKTSDSITTAEMQLCGERCYSTCMTCLTVLQKLQEEVGQLQHGNGNLIDTVAGLKVQVTYFCI